MPDSGFFFLITRKKTTKEFILRNKYCLYCQSLIYLIPLRLPLSRKSIKKHESASIFAVVGRFPWELHFILSKFNIWYSHGAVKLALISIFSIIYYQWAWGLRQPNLLKERFGDSDSDKWFGWCILNYTIGMLN